MSKYDKFECKKCESTGVTRPKSDEHKDAPKCLSCSDTQDGENEMTWVGTVEK